MSNTSLERLNELLVNWEDGCFARKAELTAKAELGLQIPPYLEGAVIHWREFRRDLLDRKAYDAQKYRTPKGISDEGKSGLYLVPFFVWAWSHHSRRVFRLSQELQASLLATSVKSITYGDLVFPFKAFIIDLAVPIFDAQGRKVNGLLVVNDAPSNSHDSDDTLLILPLTEQRMESSLRTAFNVLDRKSLNEHLQKKRWMPALKQFERMVTNLAVCVVSHRYVNLQERRADPVMEPFQTSKGTCESCGETHPFIDEFNAKVMHIVAGFCLYLQSLPAGSSHLSDWTPLSKAARSDPRAVTNEALICSVENDYRISAADLDVLNGQNSSEDPHEERDAAGAGLRPHFRRGYWRRQSGKADDPNAPKVISVRPTIVRRDLLTGGAIPSGVIAKL